MEKTNRPRGLIRYASLNSIERGEPFRFTPRIRGYAAVLAALSILFAILVATRSDVETTLLRAPGALFQQTGDGRIANLYTLKVVNKTARDMPLTLTLENRSGVLKLMGSGELIVPKEGLAQTSVLIEMPLAQLEGPKTKLKISVYSNDRRVEILSTVFVGPRT